MSRDSLGDGGPLFPDLNEKAKTSELEDGAKPTGISVRDWLAGLAMQGLLASGEIGVSYEVTAEKAYSYADAIIREGKEK